MDEIEAQALVHSLVDERLLLLARLKAYMDAADKIRQVVDVNLTRARKNEALLEIRAIADAMLAL